MQQQLQTAETVRRVQPKAKAQATLRHASPPPLLLQLLGHHHHFSSAVDTPPVCYSSDTDSDIKSLRAVQGFGRIGGASVAVEKDSDDPYLDFRQSMLQMILEKEIYSKDDLKELLNCFLQLNSPYYHGIIVRAFTEIWNGVYSGRSGSGASPNLHGNGMWMSRDF
ncbi:Transcription repressor OFP6 [Sesamum angolense]|uniref:Transcription repressor n=1 Tax=Sesamum angolense TaxID=2727404 RepID=A0AAE2BSW4_9LAMI|nr:Transcription repressor OFP6 [Sesamum angolense]